MDEVLRRSLLYGLGTTALLTPSLYNLVPGKAGKWLRFMKRPVAAALLMYLFYVTIPTQQRNFYSLLGIDASASKSDIYQAYRTVSKKYHPDKVAAAENAGNTGPRRPAGFEDMSADEFFIEIKKAQEILMSDARKSSYDRFGDFKLGDIDEKGTIIVVCLTLVAHLLCFCVGFIVSYPKHVTFARQVFLVYNLAMLCNELQIRFVEDGDSLGFFPYVNRMPPFERIHFFRSLFPFVLCGSLCISTWQFSDLPAKRMALLKALLSTNRVLTERTQELIRVTAYLKAGTPSIAAMKLQQQEVRQQQAALIRAKLYDGGAAAKEGAGSSSGSRRSSHSSRKTSGISSPQPATTSPSADSSSVASGAAGAADDQKTDTKKGENNTDWSDFTNTLNDEQRELFKCIVAEQYRRAEADDKAKEKAKARFDVN